MNKTRLAILLAVAVIVSITGWVLWPSSPPIKIPPPPPSPKLRFENANKYFEEGGEYLGHNETGLDLDETFVIPLLKKMDQEFRTNALVALTGERFDTVYSVFYEIDVSRSDEFVTFLQHAIQHYDGDVLWRIDNTHGIQLDFVAEDLFADLPQF